MRKFSIGFWVILSAVLAGLLVAAWVALQAWVIMLIVGALPWVAPIGYWLCVLLSLVLTLVEIMFSGYKLDGIR